MCFRNDDKGYNRGNVYKDRGSADTSFPIFVGWLEKPSHNRFEPPE